MPLKLRDKYTFDQLSLGEIMLRLDPGEGRIRTTREFKAWEGGGEYNVARGLRKCFGLKTAVCTSHELRQPQPHGSNRPGESGEFRSAG